MACKPTLHIIEQPIGALKPNPGNARTHTTKQISQIAASIREFGFCSPVLLDGDSMIIAGHGRWRAAQQLGLEHVPTIRIDHLSDDQKRAFMLADNKIALNAGWDPDILKIEFQHLISQDLTFDTEITGFSGAEIDIVIDGGTSHAVAEEADAVPTVAAEPVTKPGDIWVLDEHRIFCGDARDPTTFTRLMDAPARVVVADSPYNVKIDGHACGLGNIKHREFAMASGEMTKDEFTSFLKCVFTNSARVSLDGSLHYLFMDWRHLDEMIRAGTGVYDELKNLCVWNKDNAGMGSFYRSKHELVFVFKHGKAPHINNVELGRNGRYRTNVWDYPGVNSNANGRHRDLALHPTTKPVSLIRDILKDCSRRNDIVLDPFGGAGTTLIAAEKTARRARLVEIDPLYVDVTVRRWQHLTGRAAINAASGNTFDDTHGASKTGANP